MQVNPSPVTPPQKPLATPAAQAALQPAVAATGAATSQVKTQTVQASPSVGRTDQERHSGTTRDTPQDNDTTANTVTAGTNGRSRGSLLDVTV
ncbi:MAG TPA: hypothetical protein VK943_17320 [Arenibaculum sp.]|nr:hypothetical protein [Arenibaculum sp.]